MTARHDIKTLRAQALTFHKRMIDDARVRYEKGHGKVVVPGEMLRLMAFDPEFAWLRPLTGLILSIDDRLDLGEVTEADTDAVRQQIAQVMHGGDFRLTASTAQA